MPQDFRKVCLHLFRLFTPKPVADPVDMAGKKIIVTGASLGSLGFDTTTTLAKWGANVTATVLHPSETTQQALITTARQTQHNKNASTCARWTFVT